LLRVGARSAAPAIFAISRLSRQGKSSRGISQRDADLRHARVVQWVNARIAGGPFQNPASLRSKRHEPPTGEDAIIIVGINLVRDLSNKYLL
jgi:hypothetical protein